MTPPSDKDGFRWRRSMDAPVTVTITKLEELAFENDLRIIGPDSEGYQYIALKTEDGHVLYRAPSVDWDLIVTTQKTGTDAAAGAELPTIEVPAGKRWTIKAVWIRLVCSSDVANRVVNYYLKDAAARVMYQGAFGPLTASQTGTLILAGGNFTDDASGTFQLVHIPPELLHNLSAGCQIAFTTTDRQAADDFAASVTTVLEAPA